MQSRHTSMSTVIPASTTCPVTTPCPTATSVCPTLTAVEQFKTLPTCSNQLYHANTFAVGPLQLCCNGGSNALGATYHHINWQGGVDPTQYQHQAHRKAGTPVNFFYKDDDSHTFLPKVCKKVASWGVAPSIEALASHHESRGSNLVGANKCHAQVC